MGRRDELVLDRLDVGVVGRRDAGPAHDQGARYVGVAYTARSRPTAARPATPSAPARPWPSPPGLRRRSTPSSAWRLPRRRPVRHTCRTPSSFPSQPRPRLTTGTSLRASVQQARCRSVRAWAKLQNFVIRIVVSKVFALANTDKSQICVAVSKWAGTDSSRAANQDKTPPKIVRFQALTMARWSARR